MKKGDISAIFNNFGIDERILSVLAFETGLIKRERLILASDLLCSICSETTKGKASYNDLAAHLASDNGISVSKQAIWKKATSDCIDFFKKVLELVLLKKIDKREIEGLRKLGQFKRIIVQDSTIIRLPIRLFESFSGVANASSKVCNARIQVVYDLLAEQFVHFSIDPYQKNDLKAAPELVLQERDLVLRDRGYLLSEEIKRHLDNKAHCIYRYKNRMTLLDPVTNKPIDILEKLKKKGDIDIEVLLNNGSRTPVRLVAFPVNEKVAAERRRKANKEKKSPPSKEYLQLLSWSIFITTIPQEQADHSKLLNLYGLRWRIEIIFKSWKSNMGFDKIHNVSFIQLNIILLARFIMAVICLQVIYPPLRRIIKENFWRDLSILKLTRLLVKHLEMIPVLCEEIKRFSGKVENSIRMILRYCTYDKRKRPNYEQEMDLLFSLS